MNNSEYVGDDEDEDATGNERSRVNSASNGIAAAGGGQKKKGKAQRRREKAEKAHQERLEKQVKA